MGLNSEENLPHLSKKNRKYRNTAPNQKWGEEVHYLFRTLHIDHKGPLNRMSDGKHPCSVVIEAFLRLYEKNPLKSTYATHTIEAISTFICSFGISQKLVYDRGTSLMSYDFSALLRELG